jgi:hypothetical protein
MAKTLVHVAVPQDLMKVNRQRNHRREGQKSLSIHLRMRTVSETKIGSGKTFAKSAL